MAAAKLSYEAAGTDGGTGALSDAVVDDEEGVRGSDERGKYDVDERAGRR